MSERYPTPDFPERHFPAEPGERRGNSVPGPSTPQQ